MVNYPYIPDLFEEVVQKVSAHFEALPENSFKVLFNYGIYGQVSNDLGTEWDKNDVLVWLVMPYDEDRRRANSYYCNLSARLIIAVPSEMDHTMKQRAELVFKTKLIPVYERLIDEISNHKAFIDDPKINHSRRDWPYWGGGESHQTGTANLFKNFVDAIDINNFKSAIDYYNTNCNILKSFK